MNIGSTALLQKSFMDLNVPITDGANVTITSIQQPFGCAAPAYAFIKEHSTGAVAFVHISSLREAPNAK